MYRYSMTKNSGYDTEFYKDRHARSADAARRVLDIVSRFHPGMRSAVDVGCGVGTWLSVLQERGVLDVTGYDGDWVDSTLLEIDRIRFQPRDLSKPLPVPAERFDLAISLEVAEHLHAEHATTFVESLANQSDFILFSAAIPHQGGTHHVNEQWPDYWLELFAEHNYIGLDVIRPEIAGDPAIDFWYRQNTLLIVARERLPELSLDTPPEMLTPTAQVAPECYIHRISQYEQRIARMQTVKGAWKNLRRALRGDYRRQTQE